MHEMVTEWRKPINAAYIVAGLPAFSTLNAIADTIKQAVLEGFPGSLFQTQPDASFHVDADVVSPGGKACTHVHSHEETVARMMTVRCCNTGQCRVIRMNFMTIGLWGSPVEHVANVCVIRKPMSAFPPAAESPSPGKMRRSPLAVSMCTLQQELVQRRGRHVPRAKV
jgi:hypothetical protein